MSVSDVQRGIPPDSLRAATVATLHYTRRFFGGRQPLCGSGVTSSMALIVQAGGLQGGDGRLAAGAGPLDAHLDLLQAELRRLLGGHSRRRAGRRTACSCGCP